MVVPELGQADKKELLHLGAILADVDEELGEKPQRRMRRRESCANIAGLRVIQLRSGGDFSAAGVWIRAAPPPLQQRFYCKLNEIAVSKT